MFRNMSYVYHVYKERSFSKAAEKLHISQPSLSAAIRKAEEEAGALIFERKTRPVSLTPFGVEYIQGIEQVYEIEDHLHNLAYDLHTLQNGYVSIGGSNLSIPYVVPQRIAEFKRTYPKVNLNIVEASTFQCKTMLDEGTLDIIVTNRPMSAAEYEKAVCYHENLVLAVPKSMITAKTQEHLCLTADELGRNIASVPNERCVSLADYSQLPFILLSNENYLRLCCDIMFQESRATPDVVFDVETSSVAYNFANMGMGATILSNVLVENLQKNSNLLFFKLSSPYAERTAYLCYRKGRYMTAAVEKMVEFLTNID